MSDKERKKQMLLNSTDKTENKGGLDTSQTTDDRTENEESQDTSQTNDEGNTSDEDSDKTQSHQNADENTSDDCSDKDNEELSAYNLNNLQTFKTKQARRQAVRRVIKSLPKDSEKWTEVMKYVISRASPKRKSLLCKNGIISSPKTASFRIECEKTVERMASIENQLRMKRDKDSLTKRSLIAQIVKAADESSLENGENRSASIKLMAEVVNETDECISGDEENMSPTIPSCDQVGYRHDRSKTLANLTGKSSGNNFKSEIEYKDFLNLNSFSGDGDDDVGLDSTLDLSNCSIYVRMINDGTEKELQELILHDHTLDATTGDLELCINAVGGIEKTEEETEKDENKEIEKTEKETLKDENEEHAMKGNRKVFEIEKDEYEKATIETDIKVLEIEEDDNEEHAETDRKVLEMEKDDKLEPTITKDSNVLKEEEDKNEEPTIETDSKVLGIEKDDKLEPTIEKDSKVLKEEEDKYEEPTIETDSKVLEIEKDDKLEPTIEKDSKVLKEEEDKNEEPTIETDSKVLEIEKDDKLEPTIRKDSNVLKEEEDKNEEPTIETDSKVLEIEKDDKLEPTIRKDSNVLEEEKDENEEPKIETDSVVNKLRQTKSSIARFKVKESSKKINAIQPAIYSILNKFSFSKKYLHKKRGKRCFYERKIATKEKDKEEVSNFLEETVNSTMMPGKKYISKRTEKQKTVLNKTMKRLHQSYKTEKKSKMSLSQFKKLRPKHIKTRSKASWVQCLCEKCENLNLKREALEKICTVKFDDIYKMVNLTLCNKPDDQKWHHKRCIDRECENCGTSKIQKVLIAQAPKHDTDVHWKVWENVTVKTNSKRKMIVQKTGKIQELISQTLKELESFSQHIFLAKWQYHQYNELKNNLKEGTVVMTMDFSENYRCENQREIQSAHFGYSQLTLHPIMVNYICPTESCNTVCTLFIDILSDDLTHDHFSVDTFSDAAIKYLENDQKLKIEKIIECTDGCTSQYKCCSSFLNLSLRSENIPVTRTYFGPHHGKNRCDGEGAVIKSNATKAVQSLETVIQNATDMAEYCKKRFGEKMQHDGNHQSRKFLVINEINRKTNIKANTVKGSRQFFCVKGQKNKTIEARSLSCFCTACLNASESTCENKSYVEQFKVIKLKTEETVVKLIEEKCTPDRELKREKEKEVSKVIDLTSKRQSKENCTVNKKLMTEKEVVKVIDLTPNRQSRKNCTVNKKLKTEKDVNVIDLTSKRQSSIHIDDIIEISPKKLKSTCASFVREEFFKDAQVKLQKATTYVNFLEIVIKINREMQELELPIQDTVLLQTSLPVDEPSKDLFPDDVNQNMSPRAVYGDGNCLFRAVSIFIWGNENHHLELRIRTTIEMALNEDLYLDNTFLQRGLPDVSKAMFLTKQYCQFLEGYVMQHLTDGVIQNLYRFVKFILICKKKRGRLRNANILFKNFQFH